MINPAKMARFLGKLFLVLLLIFAPILGLVLFTELRVADTSIRDVAGSWRFWLLVGRDLVPAVIALLGVYILAARFVQRLYRLSSLGEARSYVHHSLFGLWSFGPWLRSAEGVLEGGPEHVLNRLGGPGHLVIYNDSAVLLERAGKFMRVQGKGFLGLEPFERAYGVVDLRPLRRVHEVFALSKEGIQIVCEADISYQIDTEAQEPTEEEPYPASDETVFRAATCTWVREANRPQESRTMDWADRVILSEAEGTLRTLLARCTLDQLIGLTDPRDRNHREEIRAALEGELRAGVAKLGAQILGVELGDIRVADHVTQQWIDAWRARWEKWVTENLALGRALQVEKLEEAKTRSQVMMIKAISSAFRPMRKKEQAMSSRLILARLFMVLGRSASDPWTRVFLPPEALNTLKVLQDIVQRDT
jgi:regulator of protease activity HflC (stomatin/prohibitin superfamily)